VLLVALLLFAGWQSLATLLAMLVTLLIAQATAAVVVDRDSARYLGDSAWSNADAHDQKLVAPVVRVAVMYALFAALAALSTAVLGTETSIGQHLAFAAPTLLACLAVAFLSPVGARVWNQLQLLALRPPESLSRPVFNRRLAAINAQMDGNTVIYSGRRPFVGSGMVLRRWDLTKRLVRSADSSVSGVPTMSEAEREFPTPPFTAGEITAHVRDEIAQFNADALTDRPSPNLTVHDRVFVAGTEISRYRRHTGPDALVEIIRNPSAAERRYLAIQVVSWRGELVTTVYVHFAVQGKSLYVELHLTGLLPCDDRFQVIDEVGGTGPGAVVRDAARALLAAPSLVASAPRNLLHACVDVYRLSFADDLERIRLRRGYDYGAAIGIRELGASPASRDPMRVQGIMKYGQLIERRVLASILDFLEHHGVDVTDYRQQSLTILSAGAVATAGGTVNVNGDAIGTQAVDTDEPARDDT
jgi:hypothetical protein